MSPLVEMNNTVEFPARMNKYIRGELTKGDGTRRECTYKYPYDCRVADCKKMTTQKQDHEKSTFQQRKKERTHKTKCSTYQQLYTITNVLDIGPGRMLGFMGLFLFLIFNSTDIM